MHRSNGNDEPTRAEAGSSPRRSTRNAQSNEAVASTPSLPGRRNAPPRDALAPTTAGFASPANGQPPSDRPGNSNPGHSDAESPTQRQLDNIVAAVAANDHGNGLPRSRSTTHDPGAAREEGTAGNGLIAQPSGLPRSGVDEQNDNHHHDHQFRRVSEAGAEEEARADDTALDTANDREATELAPMSSASSTLSSNPSSSRRVGTASTAEAPVLRGESGDNPLPPPPPSEAPTCRDDCSVREQRKLTLTRQEVGWWDVVTRWWRRQVSVTVPAGGMRDHLALERTFLGYLRTSIALSMTGVMIAQLMRLQHAPSPDPHFGYHALGKPLAAVFITAAIAMVILGAFRFWRQQNAIVRGKVFAGGWEIFTIMIGSTILTTTVFGLLLAVDIKKELEGSG